MKYLFSLLVISLIGFGIVHLTFSAFADKVIKEAELKTQNSYNVSAIVKNNIMDLQDDEYVMLQNAQVRNYFQDATNINNVQQESLMVQ